MSYYQKTRFFFFFFFSLSLTLCFFPSFSLRRDGDPYGSDNEEVEEDGTVIEALSGAPVGVDIDPNALGNLDLNSDDEGDDKNNAGFVTTLQKTFSGMMESIFASPHEKDEEEEEKEDDGEEAFEEGANTIDGGHAQVDNLQSRANDSDDKDVY